MNYKVLFSAVLAGTLAVCSQALALPQGVNLAEMADWDVVIPAEAIASEIYAAEEFVTHFERATGIKLAIAKTVDRPDRHVFIGCGEAMRSSNVGFSVDGFGSEDLRIVIRDGNIAIAGGRPRGTLYGVYTFLEDYLGVRFLTHDHTYVPKIDEWFVVGPVDRFYHPPLAFRLCFYGENREHPALATRLRNNAITDDPRLGGKTGWTHINHSLFRQLPIEKYAQDHPEYYCLIDGKRLTKGVRTIDIQPCLSNPDVLRIVTESVLAELKANPHLKSVSVSQNDRGNYCQCPKCAAIDQREGTPMGSILKFVNAVADQVAKQYPGVMVGTLSYYYSRKPPKTIKPRPNVLIQLCSYESCLSHPINDPNCPNNVAFCRDMNAWSKICKHISVWNYNTNFGNYLLPCPNLRVLEPNVRYFVAHNAMGLFMQCAGNTIGAEFSELRNYMISNLMWDPTRSGQKLMDEFLDLHYGRAAAPIRRFINLVHDYVAEKGIHRLCYGRARDFGIDQTIAQAGLEAFDQALAEDETVRSRVEKASICAYRAAIEPIWGWMKNQDECPAAQVREMRPLVQRFFHLCEKYGVTQVDEQTTVEQAYKRLNLIPGLLDQ